MSSAKSIKAGILLTNSPWKSNPIDTTKLEVNSTYICRHQARPLDSTTQGTESHSQRHIFGTPDTWEETYGPWQSCCQPERASAPSIRRLHCPPSPQAFSSSRHCAGWAPSRRWVKGMHTGWSLEPWQHHAHAHSTLCLQASGAEREAEDGKEQHRPDGNKKLLLTRHWQQPEVVWTTASKGFLTGGITGCTHIVRWQTLPSIQMQTQPDCYPGYYWEVHSGNQILIWLQLSLSNTMNTVLNIIGNPAEDNRTTHVLSYGTSQVIPGNLYFT